MLELYNALNNSHYTNVNDLEITTIEDVIYMGYKNDISFILSNEMHLYEHQSTYNPNMPLRGLLYFAKLYEKYISKMDLNIYNPPLKKIPKPRYYIFYNGEEFHEEHEILKLSDAFYPRDDSGECEWTAHLININYGRNKKLMKQCKKLEDYAILINKIKRYNKQYGNLETAVENAVDECITEDRLKDFLLQHKAEVIGMILTEWNEEKYLKSVKENEKMKIAKKMIQKGMDKDTIIELTDISEDEFNKIK